MYAYTEFLSRVRGYTAAVLLVTVLYLIILGLYNITLHPLRKFPGPWLFGFSAVPISYHRLCGRGHYTVQALHRMYGLVVRLGPNELSYIDSQAWKDIYGNPSFLKDLTQLGPNPPGVQGLLRADKPNHTRQRRVFLPAFSEKSVKEQEGLFRKYTSQLIDCLTEASNSQQEGRWDSDAWRELTKLYNLTAFDIMGEWTFGESLELLEGSSNVSWVDAIFGNLKFISLGQVTRRFGVLHFLFNLLVSRRLLNERQRNLDFVARKVDRRLDVNPLGINSVTGKSDLWAYLLRAGVGEEITRPELYANVGTFMIAGTETTASTMSAFTYLLCRNPDKLKQAQQEVRTLKSSDQITFMNLQGLEYLNACIKESLRIFPPFPATTMRLVPKGGAIICGKWVPENTTVGVHHLSSYHSPLNWTRPDEFLPERWLPNADESFPSDNKAVFQPFSAGPRGCMGITFAYNEMRVILGSVLWHFDIDLVDRDDNWLDQNNYDLWEKKPLYISLKPSAC